MTSRIVPFATASQRSSGRRHDIAIVGDGIVGLACSLAAAQAGLRVGLIAASRPSASSAADGEPWDRRVYAISPTSRRFLESMRVWNQLDPLRVAPIREMRVYGDINRTSEIHFSAYQAGSNALAWIVEHRELCRVLNAAINFQHNLERIESDAEEFRVDQDEVSVLTLRGSVKSALLVAADGAQSKTREGAGLVATRGSYDQTAVVANFSTGRASAGIARQWFSREGVVALLPLPGDVLSLVWSAPTRLAATLLEADEKELARRVQLVAGDEVESLTPLGGASGFSLTSLHTEKQAGNRVALVGDAAHVVHPLAGQGLNLGLQDVESLVSILKEREGFRDCGDPVLLRRYERSRSEAVWAMRHVTHGLNGLFASTDPTVSRLRTRGMNLVNTLPMLKRALIRRAMG